MATATLTTLTAPPPDAWRLQNEAWGSGEPQGVEHKKLREAGRAALRQWERRAEYLLATEEVGEDYNSVPLQAAFTRRVIYRRVGPLSPPSYSFDE